MWTDGGRGPKLVSTLRQRSWEWPARVVMRKRTTAIVRDMGLLKGRFLKQPLGPAVTGDYVAFAVIGRTDQRTTFDIIKPHFVPRFFQFGEFVGVDESDYREVFRARLQVLAECDDIDAAGA